MAPLILIADDDGHIREVIRFALEKAGMDVIAAKDGAEALRLFGERSPELIVLDVGMPELDGLDVCRELRKTSDVPILFLSARDEEIDRILGLEMGGDDYVTKPFSPRELVARVKVILKRRTGPVAAQETKNGLAHGALQLDTLSHVAEFAGEKLDLTALEFGILKAFLGQKQRAFTRDQIIDAAYAANMHVSDRTIDSHIRNIRAKLGEAECASVIETVHGVGFRLGACERG
ncbi:MAG: response regulator transcription factor [Rhizobiaceae bacterium]